MKKIILVLMLISIIGFFGIKLHSLTKIVNNSELLRLDLAERSHYIGCRRVSENHSYCKELSQQWRRGISLVLGLTDTKGSCLED